MVSFVAKSLARFYKGPGSKGRRHHRWRSARRKERAPLPVEVITPGSAVPTGQLHRQQVIQQGARFELGLSGLLPPVIRECCESEESDPFRISFPSHAGKWAQVDR